jgi:hypothetical protein
VYELKAEDPENRTSKKPIPDKVVFFVDELNKYAPSGHRGSPILEQVLDIAERGRSLGLILFSAQQFMSAVHGRVTGNCATKILGRIGASEIASPDYRFLDDDLKMNLTRLGKGELIVTHAVYRQPVRIVFPRPAYKQRQPGTLYMTDPVNTIRAAAQLLTDATVAAARHSQNEAAFRIPFQAAIAEAAKFLGVPIQPRDEMSLVEGRAELARIKHHEPITLQEAVGLTSAELQNYLRTMEEGGIFRHLGIRNFLERFWPMLSGMI